MMCFSYRGGGWSTICSRKLKVSLFFFFQYFKFEGRDGGGGRGYINESLYRESKD